MVLIWNDGYVPYLFDKKIANIQEAVVAVMKEITFRTRYIQFVPRRHEKDYLFITEGERCSSYVGRCCRGRQELYLDLNNLQRPVILHELCHALGLYHEHQRSMRDEYVKIHFDNIQEEQRVHFIKMIPQDDIEGLQFDYFSIMLYGNKSFVKDTPMGLKSITAVNDENRYLPITEKKKGLSSGDIDKLQHLYEDCQDKTPGHKHENSWNRHGQRQHTNQTQQCTSPNCSHRVRSKSADNFCRQTAAPPTFRQPPRTLNFTNSLNEYRNKSQMQQTFPRNIRQRTQSEICGRQLDLYHNDRRFACSERGMPVRHYTYEEMGGYNLNNEVYNRSHLNSRETYRKPNFQDSRQIMVSHNQDNLHRRQINSYDSHQRTWSPSKARMECHPAMNRVDNHRNTDRRSPHIRNAFSLQDATEKEDISPKNEAISCNDTKITSNDDKKKPNSSYLSQEKDDSSPSAVSVVTDNDGDSLLSEIDTEPSAPLLEEQETNEENTTKFANSDS